MLLLGVLGVTTTIAIATLVRWLLRLLREWTVAKLVPLAHPWGVARA